MRREPYKATSYTPPPYNGDGLEVIANLPTTLSPGVVDAIARWHERRHTSRNRVIASALRALVPTNDNSGRR